MEVCGGGRLSRTREEKAIKETYEVLASILAVSYTDRVSCSSYQSSELCLSPPPPSTTTTARPGGRKETTRTVASRRGGTGLGRSMVPGRIVVPER